MKNCKENTVLYAMLNSVKIKR